MCPALYQRNRTGRGQSRSVRHADGVLNLARGCAITAPESWAAHRTANMAEGIPFGNAVFQRAVIIRALASRPGCSCKGF